MVLRIFFFFSVTNIHTSTSSPAKISSYWLYYSATEGTRPFYSCIFIGVNLNLNVLHSAPQGGKRGCFLSACRPVLTLRRQGSKQLQRQETISIDSGFPFLCSHSRREGLFKITELVMIRCKVLLPTVYFVLPVIYEGPFFLCVSYKRREIRLSVIDVSVDEGVKATLKGLLLQQPRGTRPVLSCVSLPFWEGKKK